MQKPKKHETFYVQVVQAFKSAPYLYHPTIGFGSLASAIETCERLQREFDEDCEPRRVYVLDETRVPIKAGGTARMSALESLRQ